jgi:HK97 family phage major capsid protein
MKSGGSSPDDAAPAMASMIKAIKHGDFGNLNNLGCFPASESREEGWKQTDWTIRGKPFGEGSEKAALGTVLRGDATTGSYLVPETVARTVLDLALQASVCMGKVNPIDMAVRKIRFPKSATAVSIEWPTDESTAKTETNPTFGYVDLECKTAAAWLTVTDELEEDSAISLAKYFLDKFSEAWGQEIDYQVLAANSDPFIGLLHAVITNVVQMGAGRTGFGDLSIDDLYDMQDALTYESAHVRAAYIFSRYVFNKLRRLKDDNGDYIIQPAIGGEPASLLGKPYIISEKMPAASDDSADTAFIIYGDLKNYLMGTRVGFEFRRYGETVRNIDYDQVFYRMRARAAFIAGREDAFVTLKTAAS